MSNTQPKPNFAKDYITSAQIASLGYLAKSGLLKPGMTGLERLSIILGHIRMS
jgi:hypothetical protein